MHVTIAVRGISKFLSLALALVLASCGGGGGGGSAGGGGPAPTFTLSGTVSGLAGTGLVLQNNGGDNLPVPGNGTFSFATAIASNASYNVTVLTQPTNLSQTCAVSNGSGTMASANLTNIAVSCATNSFTVGGTVSGYTGAGLILRLNGTTDLPIAGNGNFAFGAILDGSAYAVLVSQQPIGQTCGVSNGSGALAGANVTSVAVTCVTNGFLIGGTVTGLAGTGLKLRNNNNALDEVTVSGAGTVPFIFGVPIANGSPYLVTVTAQPTNPSQTCTVTNASGTVAGAHVINVAVNCVTNTYTISGLVSGLAGTGLVLRNNGGNDLSVSADGTFSFTTPIASGAPYNVSVATQPTNLSQTCTITNGTGTVGSANVTGVSISCSTSTYTIGGTISGLAGTGLVLQNNGGNNLPVSANGTFTFTTPIASGAAYAVTVSTQPGNLSQTCTVTNASGTVGGANVTNVSVSCITNSFTVGGTVSGSNNLGFTLRLNGTTDLIGVVNGAFVFPAIPDGSAYSVTVFSQPIQQNCTVTGGSGGTGTVGGANIISVAVNCVTNTYTIGGTVSGLAGTGLVPFNLGTSTSDLTVLANATAFTFAAPVAYNSAYDVTVLTPPSNPTQTCTVTNGSGTMGSAPVTNVAVNCVTNTYTIGGTVSGLAGTGLVLRNNGGNDLPVAANGTFTFTTPIASGAPYAVTVFTHPSSPTQTCTVTSGTGTVGGANVAGVSISCSTNTYTIGGTVTGLAGTGLVLQNNLGNNLAVSANGAFSFTTPIASGAPYAVTVFTHPSSPTQTCTVTNGSGTVASADIANVAVNCVTNSYTIGGNVTGLAGTGLKLRNNNSALDEITVSGTGTIPFTFATPIASGALYAVTVFTQPVTPTQICTVTSGSGTVGGANVTNVAVACVTRPVAPTLGGFNVKQLQFTWPVVSGATHYKFFENADGVSGYTQVGGDLATPSITHTIPVHRRLNASYLYQACNGAVCGPDSDALILGASLTNAIGYVKASNPDEVDAFGVSVALSSDGSTLAVGAYQEDSDDALNQSDNSALDSGAVYIFVKNATTGIWSQQAYLKASNIGAGDLFGFSVALSSNGNTLAVGAYREDSAAVGVGGNQVDDCAPTPAPPAPPPVLLNCAANSGAVYVFTRTGTTWSPQAYIKASNTGGGAFDLLDPINNPTGTNDFLPGDGFGYSVALSGDGNTLSVGAPFEDSSDTGPGADQSDNSAENAGAVYVFTRSAGTWSQQTYVKASNTGAGDQFGFAVALNNSNGNTLAVGARFEESSSTGVNSTQNNLAASAGAAYVFTRGGSTWSQQAYIKASNTGVDEQFGSAVALSGDGNTLAVGAPWEDSNATGVDGNQADNTAFNSGAVYVYTRSGSTWSQQAYVKASNTGGSVAGIPDPSFGEGDLFGFSVALSTDGNTLAVGAPYEDSNATGIGGNQADNSAEDAGAVYVFTRSGSTWSQQAYVKGNVSPQSESGFDYLGYSVSLNSDGNTLAAGAFHEEGSGSGINPLRDNLRPLAGAVFLY